MATEAGRAELEAELASDAGCSRAMATLFTLQERTPLLIIHSLLHLLGYDHETDADWEIMTRKEEEIIKLYHEKMGLKEHAPSNLPAGPA
jgi:ssRNA-specific RNase YbeY (16S rRNA maturation enzyme)